MAKQDGASSSITRRSSGQTRTQLMQHSDSHFCMKPDGYGSCRKDFRRYLSFRRPLCLAWSISVSVKIRSVSHYRRMRYDCWKIWVFCVALTLKTKIIPYFVRKSRRLGVFSTSMGMFSSLTAVISNAYFTDYSKTHNRSHSETVSIRLGPQRSLPARHQNVIE